MSVIHDKQPMIEYGFKDMDGNIWCDSWVDSYNELTRLVNKSAGIEICSGLLVNERDFYLNQRHKLYVQFLDIKRNGVSKVVNG